MEGYQQEGSECLAEIAQRELDLTSGEQQPHCKGPTTCLANNYQLR